MIPQPKFEELARKLSEQRKGAPEKDTCLFIQCVENSCYAIGLDVESF